MSHTKMTLGFVQKCIHACIDWFVRILKHFGGGSREQAFTLYTFTDKGIKTDTRKVEMTEKHKYCTLAHRNHISAFFLTTTQLISGLSSELLHTYLDFWLIKDKSKCSFSPFLTHSPPLLSKACGPIVHLSLSVCSCVGWALMLCLVDSSPCSPHLSHSQYSHEHKETEKNQAKIIKFFIHYKSVIATG